jgi:hypothetical protein
MMKKREMITVNQHGDTALDFLISRIVHDSDLLYSDNLRTWSKELRYQMLQEFLEMIDDAQDKFESSLRVEPDPMLDPQLG